MTTKTSSSFYVSPLLQKQSPTIKKLFIPQLVLWSVFLLTSTKALPGLGEFLTADFWMSLAGAGLEWPFASAFLFMSSLYVEMGRAQKSLQERCNALPRGFSSAAVQEALDELEGKRKKLRNVFLAFVVPFWVVGFFSAVAADNWFNALDEAHGGSLRYSAYVDVYVAYVLMMILTFLVFIEICSDTFNANNFYRKLPITRAWCNKVVRAWENKGIGADSVGQTLAAHAGYMATRVTTHESTGDERADNELRARLNAISTEVSAEIAAREEAEFAELS